MAAVRVELGHRRCSRHRRWWAPIDKPCPEPAKAKREREREPRRPYRKGREQQVLGVLNGRSLALKDIASKTGMSPSGASNTLRAMERKQQVERFRSEALQRLWRLTLGGRFGEWAIPGSSSE